MVSTNDVCFFRTFPWSRNDVLIHLQLSPAPVSLAEIISKSKPFFDKFEIKSVLAKQAPGDRTPPVNGNFDFSFKMVVADKRSATQVAPYPTK